VKVIKRNGKSVSFNPRKIKNAIRKAGFVSDEDLNKIVDVINEQAERRESMTIEDIQDLVEFMLMKTGNEQVAREYIRYRKTRELIRQSEATNESILKLIDDKNEYLKTENSNKNHAVASTQRDYIAGEVSKDISMRLLLSKDIVDAHKKGAIHAHDCIVA
jgi:anaerobic ribonucleoside-triphosphate reductase